MEKKTEATDKHPEIIWDDLKTELLEKDPEERMEVFIGRGFDSEGREYGCIATFFCDELEKIEDIDLIPVIG